MINIRLKNKNVCFNARICIVRRPLMSSNYYQYMYSIYLHELRMSYYNNNDNTQLIK